MAQRDYVSRGRTNTRRRKSGSRSKRASSGISKTMVALAVAVLVTFIGGLYFIAHNKSQEAVILPNHGNHTGNGLPPKPEERWRYIKELENRQIGVQTPTEPSSGGEVRSPAQLTDEQRQLLEQIQADMRQQPTHLNEVPYNEQSKTSVANSRRGDFNPPTAQAVPRQASPSVQSPPRQTMVTTQPRQAATAEAPSSRQTGATAQITQPRSGTRTDNASKEKSQRYLIQCGSYKAVDQAESVRAQLAFGGIESRIAASGGWNRVMLGPYSSRASVDKSLQELRGAGMANCIPIATGG
ncbi:cell division protein FtsN [Martelella alba]|uniref:Cell division protein FtsN n=1 Tax=Martelella alba TaxID=2590451 RepID=A0ABY2SF05_9HYPH|nr:cell division protein FtsN [Martelella alba]TKI03440.1 cell division protein FtsN [Martelella alba]